MGREPVLGCPNYMPRFFSRSLLTAAAALALLGSSPAYATTELRDVQLDWAGNGEIQGSPPFGGSNYFSAGASNGTQAEYRARLDNLQIVQVSRTGSESEATWTTRQDHLRDDQGTLTRENNGGRQVARFLGGTGTLENDGSASIAWSGVFTVNAYGGMVPFWVRDPKLIVTASGAGTLTADLGGFGSTQADPNTMVQLPWSLGVTVSSFQAVTIPALGAVNLTPTYAGVAVTSCPGADPQFRTGDWGSWPQDFVNFHCATGLASYWYSSGGQADALKSPLALQVTVGSSKKLVAPPPPVTPAPKPASISRTTKAIKLNSQRRATIATIKCPDASCKLSAPKTVKAKIRGKSYKVTVSAPKSLAKGKTGYLRVNFTKAQAKRLKGRSTKVTVKLKVTYNGSTTSMTVKATVKGR